MAPAAPVSIYIYLCLYLYLCLFIDTHMHVRDSHASLESQEVDPMRFPARGTSDEDE